MGDTGHHRKRTACGWQDGKSNESWFRFPFWLKKQTPTGRCSLSLSLLWVVPFSYSLPSACLHPIPSKITISSRDSQVMYCAHSSTPHLPFLFFLNCFGYQPNKLLNRGFSQYSCSCKMLMIWSVNIGRSW